MSSELVTTPCAMWCSTLALRHDNLTSSGGPEQKERQRAGAIASDLLLPLMLLLLCCAPQPCPT